jgi:HD-GYP domain-containing protein (c-di-GMP phosphodiesterase class II)
MKTHTTKGANILRPVTQLREMLPGIELHHEALNGRGYPYGLKGDEIPLMPRVIAVADTFDALTTNRPYQKAFDPVEAVRIIRNLSGQRLDPTAVNALLAVFHRGEIRLQKQLTETAPVEPVVQAPAPIVVPPASNPLIVEASRT